MHIRWEADAIDDLTELRNYIEQHNPAAARHTAKKILDTVNLLTDHPLLGKAGRIHTTRELVVSGTPYTLVYLAEAESVSILRIFHQARRWSELADKG